MLSGRKIREILQNSEVGFTGLIRGNALLLTLGNHLLEFSEGSKVIEPWKKSSVAGQYGRHQVCWRMYDLGPGKSVLVSATEHLRMPSDIGGAIGTLSHVARLGLFAHFSSPFIGPLYAGYLALELLNVSPHTLRLRQGMPMAKIVLFRTDGTDPQGGPEAIPFWYNSSLGTDDMDLRSRFPEEFGSLFEEEYE